MTCCSMSGTFNIFFIVELATLVPMTGYSYGSILTYLLKNLP